MSNWSSKTFMMVVVCVGFVALITAPFGLIFGGVISRISCGVTFVMFVLSAIDECLISLQRSNEKLDESEDDRLEEVTEEILI